MWIIGDFYLEVFKLNATANNWPCFCQRDTFDVTERKTIEVIGAQILLFYMSVELFKGDHGAFQKNSVGHGELNRKKGTLNLHKFGRHFFVHFLADCSLSGRNREGPLSLHRAPSKRPDRSSAC